MTRGTLAYAEYDFDGNCFQIKVSDEFNGDMGPDMAMGEKTLQRLAKAATPDHFEKAVYDTVHDFGYEDDYDSEDPADMMSIDNGPMDAGMGLKDDPFKMSTPNVLSKTFNYSDYEYIMSYGAPFYVEDKNGKPVTIEPGTVYVFSFCEYVGKADKDGNFIDETEDKEYS